MDAKRNAELTNDRPGLGCALALLGFNTVLIGVAAASFMQGPFSSAGQELWYRYGYLGFFIVGSVLPAIALFATRRTRDISGASIAWMGATFLAFCGYLIMSGGGV